MAVLKNDKFKWRWMKILWTFIGLYGLYSLITLSFHQTSYRIYLSHPDESGLLLEIKEYWGLKRSLYPLEYYENRWKYKLINEIETTKSGTKITTYGDLKSVPVIDGIFNPDYIDDIDNTYHDY
jgi:hypothetical protein